jgi:hypothetical protein
LPELNKNTTGESLISPPKRHKKVLENDISNKERSEVHHLNVYNHQAEEVRNRNFKNQYDKTINEYQNTMQNPSFRNNSQAMRGVFATDKDLALPAI